MCPVHMQHPMSSMRHACLQHWSQSPGGHGLLFFALASAAIIWLMLKTGGCLGAGLVGALGIADGATISGSCLSHAGISRSMHASGPLGRSLSIARSRMSSVPDATCSPPASDRPGSCLSPDRSRPLRIALRDMRETVVGWVPPGVWSIAPTPETFPASVLAWMLPLSWRQ